MRVRIFLILLAVASSAQAADISGGHRFVTDEGPAVQLRLLSPDAIEVSYTLPAQCTAVPFIKKGQDGQETRANWQALDDCGAAGADQLSRNKGACPVLRFRVPPAISQPGYPAAFPLGQGVYVHLSKYALADSCGKVGYHFSAPGILMDGHSYQGAAVANAAEDTAALLLQAPQAQRDGEPVAWFDPRLSAAAVAQIKAVAEGTVNYLRVALPDARYHPPIMAAVYATRPGGPGIGGDAGDVLRLSLFNWPSAPGPDEQANLRLLVAHEFSHRFQLRDAVDVYPDASLIHEGGGEFLRWMTSVQQGWLTRAQAAADLDQALTNCALYAEQRSWRALTPRFIRANRLQYSCGLAIYTYVLAARQGVGTAMSRINGFYKELGSGGKPDFGKSMECGSSSPCEPRWLNLLLSANGSMDQHWIDLFGATGLATLQQPSQAQRDAMVLRAVVKLMKDNCGGSSGTTETPEGIILDGIKDCKTFSQDAYVTRIEGLPVFGNPATGEAITAACKLRHRIELGLRDGGKLDAPCQQPYVMRQQFYHADIDKVLAALTSARREAEYK
ncbi:hypothetical protein [Massilia horti]|uniref:Peptidase M61 catalytic domain-containing protein n=1 Tax=Massilia horti TaxID=2562153 RepID=A0A4Y9T5I1_9BURK|nr:hypothetical protein [Massilia horti]TFW33703.1 hypothetical protein E4O92_05770 [Massilia horti]